MPDTLQPEARSFPRVTPDVIREAFETGRYPYAKRLTRRVYEARKAKLQAELLKVQIWAQETGPEVRHPVRGPRRRRQGRHDQALHRTPQPPLRPRRGAEQALRQGARPVVLPALHRTPADRGRDGLLRPLLVQPRRRRAGDGLLHAQRLPRVHAPGARVRADARPLGHPALQVLVLGHPRGAARRFTRARPTRSSAGSSRPSTRRASTSGTTTPRPRRRCSSTPTPPTRPGSSSSPTTRSARGSRRCGISCRRIDYPGKDRRIVKKPDPLIVGRAEHVVHRSEHILGTSLHPDHPEAAPPEAGPRPGAASRRPTAPGSSPASAPRSGPAGSCSSTAMRRGRWTTARADRRTPGTCTRSPSSKAPSPAGTSSNPATTTP
jgi:polyphosphate kinase